MDNLDFLDGDKPESETVTNETEVETPEVAETPAEPETAPTRERDEKGKFKAKEAMVPLAALHETRDEVKALKAQLEKLAAPKAEPQEAPKAPDIFEDPEGFVAHQTAQTQRTVYQANLQWSERLATIEHGADVVAKAKEWGTQMCDSNPAFNQAVGSQPDPYGFVIREYQRHQSLAALGDANPKDIEAFLAWREAQNAPPPDPTPVTPAIPETLADAQSARGSTQAVKIPTLDEILGRSA